MHITLFCGYLIKKSKIKIIKLEKILGFNLLFNYTVPVHRNLLLKISWECLSNHIVANNVFISSCHCIELHRQNVYHVTSWQTYLVSLRNRIILPSIDTLLIVAKNISNSLYNRNNINNNLDHEKSMRTTPKNTFKIKFEITYRLTDW